MGGSLYYDDRYKGYFGISRYASEVVARLPHYWRPAGLITKPFGRLDPIDLRRLSLAGSTTIYSPSFGAGITRATQILTVHDLIHRHDRLRWPYYNKLVRPAAVRAGAVFTVSEFSKSLISEWLPSGVEIIVTGNGVSQDFSREGPSHHHPRPYFVLVTNSKHHKRADLAFEAIRHFPTADLFLVSQDLVHFRRLASTFGVERQVHSVSRIDDADLAALMRGCRAVLVPSTEEGFGLPAVEARACGVPVIHWSGCHGVREATRGSGVEFAELTASSLAEVMADVLADNRVDSQQSLFAPVTWDEVASVVNKTLKAVAG